ncbi:MAG TPA: PQQ-binding-like beta-propeller repeat protein, partial [Bryobacteraceae bacterium]
MKTRLLLSAALAASLLPAQVTYERLLHADKEPQNWLTYSGSYAGIRFSPLNQINTSNVKNLQMKWVYHPIYMKTGNNQSKMENTPLVVDGILYTGTALEAVALDAVTGRQYWKLSRPLDPKAYYNAYEVNKGMAIAGDTLFWATVDCHLLAIDTKTGKIIWDKLLADFRKGYQYNVAPLIVRNMIILGPATNEAGANCWVAAYDIKTGKELWRFYTAPMSAGDPAAKTWAGDSWKHGGSPIWNGGAYDPKTNL